MTVLEALVISIFRFFNRLRDIILLADLESIMRKNLICLIVASQYKEVDFSFIALFKFVLIKLLLGYLSLYSINLRSSYLLLK